VIDWAEIRRKGEEGLLTGNETDALCDMASHALRDSTGTCPMCGMWVPGFAATKWGDCHKDTCPVRVLEAAGDV